MGDALRPVQHEGLTALRRDGHGTPVVLVHGILADAAAWTDVAQALRTDHPVVVLNRRGRHPGPDLPKDYSVATEVGDLLSWLARIGTPTHVVAHSYGGLIAVEAARRGVALGSLTLYEPVAAPFGAATLPGLTEALSRDDVDTAVEIVNVDISGYAREHVAALRAGPSWPQLTRLVRPAGAEVAALQRFGFDPSRYGGLSQPVTVIAGERSRHRRPYGPCTDAFAAALGVTGVVELPGQDHLAHITGPHLLAAAIDTALAAAP